VKHLLIDLREGEPSGLLRVLGILDAVEEPWYADLPPAGHPPPRRPAQRARTDPRGSATRVGHRTPGRVGACSATPIAVPLPLLSAIPGQASEEAALRRGRPANPGLSDRTRSRYLLERHHSLTSGRRLGEYPLPRSRDAAKLRELPVKALRATPCPTVERVQGLEQHRHPRELQPPAAPVRIRDSETPPATVRLTVVAPEEPSHAPVAATAPEVPDHPAEACTDCLKAGAVGPQFISQASCDDQGDGPLTRTDSPCTPESAPGGCFRLAQAVPHIEDAARGTFMARSCGETTCRTRSVE
jgi:hypothetical protein